ncbi:MAG: ABC transporter permease [Defluviitaleaceae bacterium]|nr:ABC transporter permease [Defluviitaleaceae bacterium]
MLKYTLQRLLAAIITFFVAMLVIFILINMLPIDLMQHLVDLGPPQGGEAAAGWTSAVTQHTVDTIMERFGWDQPLPVQFYRMIINYLQFDFGISLVVRNNVPVVDVMATHLPVTMQLNFISIFFILPVGVFFGVTTALTKDSIYDHTASTFVVLFIAAPGFVIAALLQYFIAFRLGWFPILLAPEETLNWTRLHSMILPILAVSFGPIAHMARVMRAELTEAITSDYMLLARAKGQSYKQAIIHHAFRNASVPMVGTFMFLFIGILWGSLVVEVIFNIPGISRVIITSMQVNDIQLTLAILYFYVAISLLASIAFDLTLGIVDPRIRMGGKKDGQ